MAIPEILEVASPSGKTYKVPTGIFINNQFSPAAQGGELETINPATGKPLGKVAMGSAKDVDRAVEAAAKAYKTVWGRNSTPGQRVEILSKLAALLDQHAAEFAELETLDNGKPRWMAESIDIADTAGCFRYYAGLADKIEGRTIEQKEGEKLAFTRLEPIGICGQIIPWNYPMMMLGWKVAPALAAGNCVILKPAEQTPLTALRFAQLAVEAGVPPGVFAVVNGLGPEVGDAITGHLGIDKVAFTGSTAIGRRVMERAAKSNMKKVTLELGGKSPVLVFDDADLDQTVNWVALGILFNQGQDCTAGSRLFVQESIYDKFMPKLISAFKAHQVGDPFDDKTFQGPQITARHRDRIMSVSAVPSSVAAMTRQLMTLVVLVLLVIFQYIEAGKQEGAKVEVGGSAWTQGKGDLANGYFVEPTIFSGCKKGMKIVSRHACPCKNRHTDMPSHEPNQIRLMRRFSDPCWLWQSSRTRTRQSSWPMIRRTGLVLVYSRRVHRAACACLEPSKPARFGSTAMRSCRMVSVDAVIQARYKTRD